MMIATANSKGGVGKSTIAVHLALWLDAYGYKVVLADCDPQRSSSDWIKDAAPEMDTIVLGNSDEAIEVLPDLRKAANFVIVDGPAGLDEISRALLLRSDGVIVPCKASTLEARALARATKALRTVQEVREGKPLASIVLSMVGEQFVLTREMVEAAASLGFPVAETFIKQRQVYAKAPGQGAAVWSMGRVAKPAALEMDALFRELFPAIAKTNPKKIRSMFEKRRRKSTQTRQKQRRVNEQIDS